MVLLAFCTSVYLPILTFGLGAEKYFLNVSWHLSYSGRTPAKIRIAEMADQSKYYSFDEAEHEQVKAHHDAEMTSAYALIKESLLHIFKMIQRALSVTSLAQRHIQDADLSSAQFSG